VVVVKRIRGQQGKCEKKIRLRVQQECEEKKNMGTEGEVVIVKRDEDSRIRAKKKILKAQQGKW